MFSKNLFGFGGFSGTDVAVAAGLGFVGGLATAKVASAGYLGETAQGLFSGGDAVSFGSSSVEAFSAATTLRREEAKADKAKADKADKAKAIAMVLDQAIAYEDAKAAEAAKALKAKLDAAKDAAKLTAEKKA